jgi:tetratricopeptide (TPR) repeat protein
MQTSENQVNQDQESQKAPKKAENTKKAKNKNERLNWWQSLLLILTTLVISVSAAYIISDLYLWPNSDTDRTKEQLNFYKEKVELEPNNPQHRVNLGYTYFVLGDNDEAIKQLKVALDLDKKSINAYLNLAIVYNEDEQLDNSLKMAQIVIELNPKDYKGHLLKGEVYRKLKMYDESLVSLNEANRLMPRNTDIVYEIGRLSEDQGLNNEAEQIYKEALAFDPLHKNSLDGLDRVASSESNSK